MSVPALQLEGVSKTFGPIRALVDLDLEVGAGTIHSILGANGSGKSTLIKILAGYHEPDPGATIKVWGEAADSIRDPSEHGLAIVHQELGLLEEGTVLENIGISTGYGAGRLGRVNWRAERRRAAALLKRQGLDLDLELPISALEPADRTAVGICRAMRQIEESRFEHHVLLLDEPTVALGPDDVERLFALMREVTSSGGSVVFITHRLKEALAVSDRIAVLRDGRLVARYEGGEASGAQLLHDMHGPEQSTLENARAAREQAGVGDGGTVRIKGLRGRTLRSFDATWRAGEVIGVTGLAGMGQDEIPYLVMGAEAARGGSVEIDGVELSGHDPRTAGAAGIALVPANRQRQAIWTDATLIENFTIGRLGEYFRGGRLRYREEAEDVAAAVVRFDVRPPRPRARIGTLSGGNQQKLVLGRALTVKPKLLLLHEPFIGIDAAAREATVKMIDQAAAEGCCVAIFSLEYELIVRACDRIVVLSHGEVAAELRREQMSANEIIKAAQA